MRHNVLLPYLRLLWLALVLAMSAVSTPLCAQLRATFSRQYTGRANKFVKATPSLSNRYSGYSSSKPNTYAKPNPKAYYGKKAWWLNYQYFPELTIFGLSSDTLPDLKHRYSLFVGGGITGFLGGSDGSFSPNRGISFGTAYAYFPVPHFGFKAGFGFVSSSSSGSYGKFSDYFVKIDEEFDKVRYDYSFNSCSEDYKMFFFDVPVEVLYYTWGFQFGAGMKIVKPVKVSYSSSIYGVNASCYFPQYDAFINDSWVMGAGSVDQVDGKDHYVTCPLLFALTADVEYDFKITSRINAALSVFVDYSVTDFAFRRRNLADAQTEQTSIIGTSFQVPTSLVSTSLLSGMKNGESERMIKNLRYINCGVRLVMNVDWFGPPKPKRKRY